MLALRAVFILSLATVAACAAVTTADGRRVGLASDEFRSYVEKVFREQNSAASDLAFAIEDANGATPSALDAAEEALLTACAGLNELATSRRDATRIGLRRSAAIAKKAPECEQATTSARAALAAAGD